MSKDELPVQPAEQHPRRRGYAALMTLCIALALFGFFVPAPVPARLAALAVAALLPPVAATVGNVRGRRR